MPENETKRRTVLGGIATGAIGGLAGCSSLVESTTPTASETPETEIGDDTPVVGEAPAGPEAVTVDVKVVDRNGDPVADELVELEDRGGTPDDRTGQTGENGELRFIEGVGGPPCNTQTVLLPDRGQEAGLGCNNGGAELDHVFRVEQ